MIINQQLVDSIVERAQNSHMGLDAPERPGAYNLSQFTNPDFASLANLLVSAHSAKYDLISVFAAAMEVISGVPAKGYRMLDEGEMIEKGDEWSDEGSWKLVKHVVGQATLSCDVGFFRRPL